MVFPISSLQKLGHGCLEGRKMLETAQQFTEFEPTRSAVQKLIEIRRQLAKNMLVRTGGFEYESIFGCGATACSGIPHIAVRVMFRSLKDSDLNAPYHFKVLVDFYLPEGATVKEAEHFRRATNNAVKRAEWAEELVRGHAWDLKTVMSFEVE